MSKRRCGPGCLFFRFLFLTLVIVLIVMAVQSIEESKKRGERITKIMTLEAVTNNVYTFKDNNDEEKKLTSTNGQLKIGGETLNIGTTYQVEFNGLDEIVSVRFAETIKLITWGAQECVERLGEGDVPTELQPSAPCDGVWIELKHMKYTFSTPYGTNKILTAALDNGLGLNRPTGTYTVVHDGSNVVSAV